MLVRERFFEDYSPNYAAISPDGRLACVPSDSNIVPLVDVASLQTVATLGGHTDHLFAAAFHPAGQLLVTGSQGMLSHCS